MLANLTANWAVPSNVHTYVTTRHGGVSKAPFSSNNLGLHVGDSLEDVLTNRQRLKKSANLPNHPIWLDQIHSTHCVVIEEEASRQVDAVITREAQQVLAIMTADCLPILLCNKQGTEIAAIHAGWRGLANGIIENTLDKMQTVSCELSAWIGPAICQNCFEVGSEVLDYFQQRYTFSHREFQAKQDKWLANLPQLAANILSSLGVAAVFQANICTFEQQNQFYSYRREPLTGRIASLIWFD